MKKTIRNTKDVHVIISIIVICCAIFSIIMVNKVHAATQTYSITYNANGGSGAPAAQTKTKDKVIYLSSKIPQRTGYQFLGWATTSTSKTVQYKAGSKYSANSSIRLYAVWKANTYKISYDANGGTGAPQAQTKTHDKTLKLTKDIPIKKGYAFQGWSKSKGAITSQYASGDIFRENKDTVLYAVWKIKTYKISYNANGGGGAPVGQIKKYGQSIVLSKTKPKRANYTFSGWAKSKTASVPDYKAGGRYSENQSVVLYACWIRDTYTVTYNANGGTGGMGSQIKERKKDLKLTKAIPTRTGYTFIGWGTAKDAIDVCYYPGDIYKINKDIELYAIWGKSMQVQDTGRHYVFAISTDDADFGVIDTKLVYRELYKKKGTKKYFYIHSTYMSANGALLNDCYEWNIIPPKFITHINEKNNKKEMFAANRSDDTLGGSDYIFSCSNTEKVVYNTDDTIKGSCGYQVWFGGIYEGGKNVELQLCGNTAVRKNAKRIIDTSDTTYFYEMGQTAKECRNIELKADENRLLKSRKSMKIQDNGSANIVASLDNDIIYDADIKASLEEKKLLNTVKEDDIKNIIYREIIRKKLDKEVEASDCSKSIEDAESYIDEVREELPLVENYKEYLAFIAGLGVEEDTYWESQKEPYRRKLGRCVYLDKLYEEYCNHQKLSLSDEYCKALEGNQDSKKISKQEFIKMLQNAIIEKSNVVINQDIVKTLCNN